jgi:membrane-bound lytic murein transglycosylase MltF
MTTTTTDRLLACVTLLACACAPESSTTVEAADVPRVTAQHPATAAQPEPTVAQTESIEAQLEATEDPPLVLRVTKPDTSDWPAMERRGLVRVLVPRDRTNFFFAEGRLRGMEYELVHEFEKSLAGEKGGLRPQIDVAFVPVAFDQLLPALLAGLGDIAAGGLTITPEREKEVAFSEPYLTDVAQIIVAARDAPPLTALENLSGQLVVVGPGSSYLESLERLNRELASRGLAPTRVESPGRGFATEEMLELVNSGAFPYTIADRHVAELWSGVLDGLRLEPKLELTTGDRIAWAVRRDNPELKVVLDAFMRVHKKGTSTGNVLFKRYFKDTKWVSAADLDLDSGKLGAILAPLQRIAAEYGFDWRLIAAQVYQESRLDPGARSKSGAIGLMQLLPATAKDMGFSDVTGIENNLAAGIKYMAWLRDNYFSDPEVPEAARVDFALAAYNAGPGRVRRWRREAPELGIDPNVWFGGLENLALERVGFEPVRYVAGINKYFVILTRLLEVRAQRAEELEKLKQDTQR